MTTIQIKKKCFFLSDIQKPSFENFFLAFEFDEHQHDAFVWIKKIISCKDSSLYSSDNKCIRL